MSTILTKFRFRNDDGNEANATWRNNEEYNITRVRGQKFRLRTQINTEGVAGAKTFQLNYRYAIIKRNILEYSEDFDHIDWGKQGPVVTTPDATTAPDESLTATKMDESDSYAQFMLHKQIVTLNDNEIITISAYAKAAERDLFFIMLRPKSDHWPAVHFNLTTGTITHDGGGGFIDSGIESAGDGWYRVWGTLSVGSGSNTPTIYYGIKIDTSYPYDPEGDVDYNGDSTAGLYIWGAQLERGSISDYQSTSGYETFTDWAIVDGEDIPATPSIVETSVMGTNAGKAYETSVVLDHNHPGGMLVVFLRYNGADVNENTSASFNGTALTKQASIGNVGGATWDAVVELFSGNVDAADGTVTVDFNLVSTERRSLMVFSITNANEIRATNTAFTDVAALGTASNTISTEESDLVLQFCGWKRVESSVASYSSGQVQAASDDIPTRNDSSEKAGAATTTTMSTTFDSEAPSNVARIGVSIIGAASPLISPSESEYIDSDGTSVTTAQLTAPEGKTTSDFQSGLISDDTNPLPTITLGEDKYTELEWSLISNSESNVSNHAIEFQVEGTYADSTANAIMTLVNNLGTVAIGEQWENIKDLTICINEEWKTARGLSICINEMWHKIFPLPLPHILEPLSSEVCNTEFWEQDEVGGTFAVIADGAGTIYQGQKDLVVPSDGRICSIVFYLRLGGGDISGKTFTAQIWSRDTVDTDDLGDSLATSEGVTGSNSWTDYTAVEFTFTTPAALSVDDIIHVTVTTDRDATNTARIRITGELTGTLSGTYGRWAEAGNYVAGSTRDVRQTAYKMGPE